LGEILITIGAILALFIIWELFWTDVPAAVQQNAAASSFATSHGFIVAPKQVGTKQTGPAPAVPNVPAYSMIARLYVPRWGNHYDVPIVEAGTYDSSRFSPDKKKILDRGWIEHYKDTQMPGQIGNFAIAGHRTTYGKPFANINTLEKGDELIVETTQYWFVYQVTNHEIVLPDDGAVIAPVPGHPGETPTVASITLTACHPKYSAAQRYVVHGTLSYWMDKSQGTPQALLGK
jgi:sortase A